MPTAFYRFIVACLLLVPLGAQADDASDFAAAKLDQWRAMVDKALKGADFEKRRPSWPRSMM